MNLGSAKRLLLRRRRAKLACKKVRHALRGAARQSSKRWNFLVLGVAAGQQSAASLSTAAAAMIGRIASSCALTSLPTSRSAVRQGFRLRQAHQASAQCGLTTSLKGSANGVPPGPGRRYPVHFRQPGPGVKPLAPPLARTLGLRTKSCCAPPSLKTATQ
jgi:hypothetical protein